MAADARVLEGEGDEGEEGRRGGGEEGEGEGEGERGGGQTFTITNQQSHITTNTTACSLLVCTAINSLLLHRQEVACHD